MIIFQFVKNRSVVLVLLTILGFSGGCTGTTDSRPSVEISGTVTLNGSALQAGSIQFTSPKTGESAYSNLDASGHYSLSFPKADVGSEYEITVGPAVSENQDALSMAEKPQQKIKSLIPKKYFDRSSSGLTAKIEQTGKNEFNFDLKSK